MNVITDIFNIISIFYYASMSLYIRFTRVVVSELCNPGVLMMEGNPVGGGGASNPSGTGSGGGASTGRGPISISDICNPPGPDTDTGETKIRPVAERPKDITYGPRGGVIHPYATLAEQESDGTWSPDTREECIGPIRIYDSKNQDFDYKEVESNQPLAGSTASSIEEQNKRGTKLHDYYFNAKQKEFFCNVLRHEDREMYDKIFTNKRGKPATKTNWNAANSDMQRILDAFRRAR